MSSTNSTPTAPRNGQGTTHHGPNHPNAQTHGLTARLDPDTLIPQPDRPAYAALLDDLRRHLDPTSPLQDLLVERLALLAFKLRLHAQAEARLLDQANLRARRKIERENRAVQRDYEQHLRYNQHYNKKATVPEPTLKPLPQDQPAAHLLAQFARSSGKEAHALELLRRYETATQRAFDKALQQYQSLKNPTHPADPQSNDLHHHFHYHRHSQNPAHPTNPQLQQSAIGNPQSAISQDPLPPSPTDSNYEMNQPTAPNPSPPNDIRQNPPPPNPKTQDPEVFNPPIFSLPSTPAHEKTLDTA
jgi:hypothetical protein